MYDLYGITRDWYNKKVLWHNAGQKHYITISSYEDLLFSCYLISKRWSSTKLNKFTRIIKHYLEV